MTEFLLRSARVVTPEGMAPRAIHVRDGRIVSVSGPHGAPAGVDVVDVGDAVVMPGLVDTHVHINEPGRTEWEGFATATRAAAAGGVTTVLDMPLNSIPATTTVAALEAKRAAARGQCAIDVGFLGGVVPGNTDELAPLHAAGVLGFKCFLVPSGVAEFDCVDERDLRTALPVLARLGATLMIHAESPAVIDAAPPMRDRRCYADYLASRPGAAETDAIALILRLAEAFGARVHIVHLSSSDALPMLAAARRRGVAVTVETCPHYLHFAAEDIADGATGHKCAPPIRERANREALWRALAAGAIDAVVSDHSPCPPALKRLDTGDFAAAWGGIASLQHGLPVVWNGMRARHLDVERIGGWMSGAPARLAGLSPRKGAIAPGRDADFVVWHPEEEITVRADALLQRHPITPYIGARLPGAVQATYLRGMKIHERGAIIAPLRGQLIARDVR